MTSVLKRYGSHIFDQLNRNEIENLRRYPLSADYTTGIRNFVSKHQRDASFKIVFKLSIDTSRSEIQEVSLTDKRTYLRTAEGLV